MDAAPLLPVFFMHGISDNHKEFDSMQAWIRALDPDVSMYSFPICDDKASFANLWDQTKELQERLREQVQANPALFKEGYTLLCHSQGALTCRAMIEQMDDHNIHTFIALAGPQMGEFGIPSGWQGKIPWGRDLAYPFMFASPLQGSLSIANYWHDPRPKSFPFGKPSIDYLVGNTFLPVVNNNPGRRTQGPGKDKSDSEAARYKQNLLKLKKAVFTCSPADDMIIPYDSGIFNFYDASGDKSVPLEQTPLWTEDWIGLKELNDTGRLTRVVAPGVCHTCWAHHQDVFASYVAPHLPRRAGVERDVIV